MEQTEKIDVYNDRQTLSQAVLAYVIGLAERYSKAKGRFCIALSGGSLIDVLAEALDQALPNLNVDWSKWHVFWADERYVSWQRPESNYALATKRFLSRVPIPADQIHAVDTSPPPHKTAQHYASILETVLKPGPGQYPRFDLIMLGIGPDGHTASLFPDHPVLGETRAWVAKVMDAPKPPPIRITLTLPVINNARNIVWVATGSAKAAIVGRILNPPIIPEPLPAGRVTPTNGGTRWFIDQDAAAGI